MKYKFRIFVLSVIVTALLLYGCRNLSVNQYTEIRKNKDSTYLKTTKEVKWKRK